eukprot:TRINITY_DN14529_c0_g1_i3.p2 TRINITY_DN14529_c0_g1~~TRINITY_DN14529_c0_g1_i3.p2  ORF type:complete len:229 (-),score=52.43 TRINITY_DN14529_c0_g1_i3:454-1140(-)
MAADNAAAGAGEHAFLKCTEEANELERLEGETRLRTEQALRRFLGQDLHVVKITSIEERMLFVLDGVVREQTREHLLGSLQEDAYVRCEYTNPDAKQFQHHITEYNLEKFKSTQLYAVVGRVCKALFPSSQDVVRIHTNAMMYGDVAFVHQTGNNTEDVVTALVFPCADWQSEQGGETFFYKSDGEIVTAIEPKPGRIALFDGCILHKASQPSRLVFGSKFSTEFTLR